MENCVFLNSLRNQFFLSFSMLEGVIEICPDELWNKKSGGFIFWQQVLHALSGIHGWLREEKPEEIPSFPTFDGRNIYPELENDPEVSLTKADIRKLCQETKEVAKKWFAGKDDNWLKTPLFNTFTHFDNTIGQLRHLMYHIGHCEAIFREYGIEAGEYLDYWG